MTVIKLTTVLTSVALLATPISAGAGSPNEPFDLSRWEINAVEHRVESFRGRDALFLDRGTAVLTDQSFKNGIIELDIAISEIQGFAGIYFRGDEERNSEHFYIRGHQSGNPDASQYTPVFNGVSGWQIYAGPRFNAPMEMVFDRWMHMKLVVSGSRAEVYLDSDEPVFVIPQLIHEVRAGQVAIGASGQSPARFANITVRELDSPTLVGVGADPEPVSETVVDTWSVSPSFADSTLEGRTEIGAQDVAGSWRALHAGERGIANLARLSGVDRDHNTAIAAVTIDSDEARTVPAHFGFSDHVRVYLNGRLLLSAADPYRSRDYRFLGTMGFYDTVYLPLQPGNNELWFAVTEVFGGWGIALDLPDRDGLVVSSPQ